jgi:hypothetical protein
VARARPQGFGPRRRDPKQAIAFPRWNPPEFRFRPPSFQMTRAQGRPGSGRPMAPAQGKRAGALTTAFVRACPDGQINRRRLSPRDGQNVAVHFAGLVFGGIWAAAGTLFLAMSAVDAQPNCIDLSAPNAVVVSNSRQCRAAHVTAHRFVALVPRNDGISFCSNMIAFFPPIVSICDMNQS